MDESRPERSEHKTPPGPIDLGAMWYGDVCWRCGENFDGRLAKVRCGHDVCPRCAGELQER